jgi:hypothetical protein
MGNIILAFDTTETTPGLGNYESFVELEAEDTITIMSPPSFKIMGAKLYQGTLSPNGHFQSDPQKAQDMASLRNPNADWAALFSGDPGFTDGTMQWAIPAGGASATITNKLASGAASEAFEYLIWIQEDGDATNNDFMDPGVRNR